MLGFSGFFLPTAEPSYARGPMSLFPGLENPELALSVWEGELFPGGRAQSVYTLNTAALTEVPKADGSPLAIRLRPGDTYQLPGGLSLMHIEMLKRCRRTAAGSVGRSCCSPPAGPGRPGPGPGCAATSAACNWPAAGCCSRWAC